MWVDSLIKNALVRFNESLKREPELAQIFDKVKLAKCVRTMYI